MLTNSAALGEGPTFEALGKTWHFSPLGPGVQEKFAGWCRSRARERLARDRDSMEPAEYKAALKRLEDTFYGTDAYDWGCPADEKHCGPMIQAALNSIEGYVRWLQILLEKKHGKVSVETLNQIAEENKDGLQDAYDRVMDPNSASRPAGNTSGREPEPASQAA